MNFKSFLLVCCLFVSVKTIQAQNTSFTKAPLKEVLFAIEQQFEVKFTFSEAEISTKIVSISIDNTDLTSILKQLNTQTKLQFKIITARYISILKPIEKITVCGYLIDETSKTPLMGASVVTGLKMIGTVTDANGYFELKNSAINETVMISFIGYQTKTIAVLKFDKKQCDTIEFLNESTHLSEIIIKNYLTSGMQKKADGSEIMKPNNLGILPGLTEPDVLQSIQLLPGVQSPDETASGLHIRGGTPDQNLILFDGIKMYNSSHFFGTVSALNPYFTNTVKVYRSGANVKYGNHISGVIDISSDTDLPETIAAGLGTNLTHADAFVKIPLNNKIAVIASARRSFADLFSTITFNNLANKVFQNAIISEEDDTETAINANQIFNDFFYTDINVKLLIEATEKDKFSISYLHNRNKLNYLTEESTDYSIEYFLQLFNNGISGNWQHIWSDKLTQETLAYYSNFDFEYRFTDQQNAIETEGISKTNSIKEFQLQSTFNLKQNAKNEYNFGYEFTRNEVKFNVNEADFSDEDTFQFGKNDKNTAHSLFGEYVYKENAKTSFHLGLRANYYSLFKSVFFSPRIYFQTQVLPNLWMKASGELKQQNISQVNEFVTNDFDLENQVWVLANNDDIPILKSNQISIGLLYKKNRWIVDIDAYRKEIKGLTSLSRGFLIQDEDVFSEGKSTSYGIDVLVKKKWKQYSTWATYSYSKTTFKFDGINNGQAFAGNYDIRHQLQLTNSLLLGNFNMSLGWNIRTGIPYTRAIGVHQETETINYESINAERLPMYHRMDFSATYKFKFNKTAGLNGLVGFSLLNVYNQENTLQSSTRIRYNEEDVPSILKTNTASLGITPNVVFRVQF